jgi:hypothetical protein
MIDFGMHMCKNPKIYKSSRIKVDFKFFSFFFIFWVFLHLIGYNWNKVLTLNQEGLDFNTKQHRIHIVTIGN